MKRIIAIILAILFVISLAACGESADKPTEASAEPTKADPAAPDVATTADGDDTLVGGWTLADSPVVTDEVKALFTRIDASQYGASFEPTAYVASQLVAGTNHLVLCKKKLASGAAIYALVTVYEDLQGGAEITDVMDSELDASYREGIDGGWAQAASPEVTDDVKEVLEHANTMGTKYHPIALIATQVVAGMNYFILCRVTPASLDTEPYYAIAYAFADLDGNYGIAQTLGFTPSNPVD